jgi:ferredoxin-like protein FixX
MVANYEQAFRAVMGLKKKTREAVGSIGWEAITPVVNSHGNTVIARQEYTRTNNIGCSSKMIIRICFWGLYNKAQFEVEITSDKENCYCCATHFYSAEATGIEAFDYPDEILKPFIEKLKEYQCIHNRS